MLMAVGRHCPPRVGKVGICHISSREHMGSMLPPTWCALQLQALHLPG